MDSALVNGTLIDVERGLAVPGATVVIRGDRIAAVHTGPPAPLPPGARAIDCAGKWLLPGLIDSHVHLAFSAGPDHAATIATLAGDNDDRLALRQARNAQECLLAGITTVRDCGGRGFATIHLRDAVAEELIAGPRILASAMPITTTGGHLHFCGLEADGVHEVRRAVRTLAKHGADFVKVMASGGMMTPNTNPAMPQYGPDELTALVQDAHRLGKRVAAHIGCAEAVRLCLAAGVDHFEHCGWLNPDGSPGYDPAVADGMARAGAVVGQAVAGITRQPLIDDGGRPTRSRELLDKSFAAWGHFRDMRARGVPFMVSSDAGVRFTPFRDFHVSLAAYALLMDVSPAETLRAATAVPARALGLERDLGAIAPGRLADVVVLDADPLADPANVGRVSMVLLGGRIAVADGRVAPPPYPHL